MKRIIIVMIGIILLAQLVSAHAIEKGPISQSTDGYNIQFLTEPKFPVTGKDIHLDFIIQLKDGILRPGLNPQIEIHKGETTATLDLREEQLGHYSAEYKFKEPGDYKINLIIDGEGLRAEFDLEVDTFGLSGLLRSGTIIILLSLLIGLMYKDCKGKIFKSRR